MRYFTIPLDVSLGKHFFDATRSATLKSAFNSQSRFDREIFPGFYVALSRVVASSSRSRRSLS